MTLWYTLVLGVVILIFSFFIYGSFSRSLDKNLNDLLRSKAGDIGQVISSYNEEDISEITVNASVSAPKADFINAAKYAVEENTGENIFIQIFRPDKAEIVHSGNMLFSLPLSKIIKKTKEENTGVFNVVQLKPPNTKLPPLKVFTIPVVEENKFPYFIQVSTSLKPMQVELNRLITALLLFFPVAIFIIVGLGQFLTKMALSPVVNMTSAIHRITSRNLKDKIVLPDENDEIKDLAGTFNDMLARIDKAFSSQQQLVQDISHELRTPLTALKGNQEVTLNKKRSPEEYERVLRINLEEIDRMGQLVENLLFLARQENKPAAKQLPFELRAMIGQVIYNMKVLADRTNIALILEPGIDVRLDADADNIKRVFSNIIDNAVKYTPAGGRVTIGIQKKDPYAEVFITDTGTGIAQDELQHIFDRFYRVDRSRSEYGYGLGLSIAKSIIDSHNGKINVESMPGKGTTFIISLPLKQA